MTTEVISVKIIMDISYSTIDFEGDTYLKEKLEPYLRTGLGIREDGYQYAKAYKLGQWDGYTPYYDPKTQTYPTGLTDMLVEVLGPLQPKYNFTFEIIDDRPDPLLTLKDVPDKIVLENGIELRDYQVSGIRDIAEKGYGIIKYSTSAGKSYLATGLIKIALDKLYEGENITFFVPRIELFNQITETLTKGLGIKPGSIKQGKMDIRKVNVAMIPTVASALRVNPEKGVRLTEKQRVIKRIAKEFAPKFTKGINQKQVIMAFLRNFTPKSKTDERIVEELQYILDTSESDAKIKFKLNAFNAEYKEIIREKNKKKLEKRENMEKFLESVVVGIYDEVHSVQSESTYNTIMACKNALVKVGLTGTLDEKNKVLNHNAIATLHRVLSEVRNKDMLEKGVIAKPFVKITPITRVVNKGQEVDILNEKDYQTAYQSGIVDNEYRNALSAKIAELWYKRGEVVVMVVSRIEQGEMLSQLLDSLNVPHAYIHGSSTLEHRAESLQRVRDGELKVLISSTIIDEGVDINKLSVLINVAGGKSLRQLLQRVGRILRKKHDGKNEATIIDFDDRTNKYLKKHSDERQKIFFEEEFDVDLLE